MFEILEHLHIQLSGIPCLEDEDKSIADSLQLPWQQVLDGDSNTILNSQSVSLLKSK